MILGGSIVNIIMYGRETHPFIPDRPLIDFNAVLMLVCMCVCVCVCICVCVCVHYLIL